MESHELSIPKINKDIKKRSGMKDLVGKRLHKNYLAGFDLIKHVIQVAVPDAKELSEEDFNTFPMDELSKLSNEIMAFSGLTGDKGK